MKDRNFQFKRCKTLFLHKKGKDFDIVSVQDQGICIIIKIFQIFDLSSVKITIIISLLFII